MWQFRTAKKPLGNEGKAMERYGIRKLSLKLLVRLLVKYNEKEYELEWLVALSIRMDDFMMCDDR